MSPPLREIQRRRTGSGTRSQKARAPAPSRSDSPSEHMGLGAPTTPLPLSITSRLATELYDHILDEFHDSKSTLSTCSSVCHAWLPLVRSHLFFSVNLRPDFVTFLRSSPHALATVAPYIRNVGLGGGWMREQQDEFNDIILFMITLERVRKIHLETWSWSYLAPPAAAALLGGQGNIFQTVTILDLKYLSFPTFDVAASFAAQFPKLRELAFDNVTWDSADFELEAASNPEEILPPPFLSRLQKLWVYACSNRPIILWLASEEAEGVMTAPPIRSLHLPEILPDEARLVAKFLPSLASSLEDLELGFLVYNYDDAPTVQDAVGKMDLSLHTRLRSLRIHQLTLYQFPSTPPAPASPSSSSSYAEISPYMWLAPFLSRVVSGELSEITFNLWLGSESQLKLIDWNALVGVLSNPLFTKLELVHFNVRGTQEGMDDEVRGWISHRLRDWERAQACLHVSFD